MLLKKYGFLLGFALTTFAYVGEAKEEKPEEKPEEQPYEKPEELPPIECPPNPMREVYRPGHHPWALTKEYHEWCNIDENDNYTVWRWIKVDTEYCEKPVVHCETVTRCVTVYRCGRIVDRYPVRDRVPVVSYKKVPTKDVYKLREFTHDPHGKRYNLMNLMELIHDDELLAGIAYALDQGEIYGALAQYELTRPDDFFKDFMLLSPNYGPGKFPYVRYTDDLLRSDSEVRKSSQKGRSQTQPQSRAEPRSQPRGNQPRAQQPRVGGFRPPDPTLPPVYDLDGSGEPKLKGRQ